jgi:hypothetical protein
MDDLKERITAKLGPLPVWAWGVIAAVLALIAYFYYQRSSGSNDTVTVPTLDAGGYRTSGMSGPSNTITSDVPENNQTWLNRVSAQVANAMGASPSEVFNALTKWLQGLDYTQREKDIIDRALGLGGNPPEGTMGLGSPINPDDAISNPNPSAPNAPSPEPQQATLLGFVGWKKGGEIARLYSDGSIGPLGSTMYKKLGSPVPRIISKSEYYSYKRRKMNG